jgi:hypothetical protein
MSEEFQELKSKFANVYGTFGVDPVLEQQGVILRYELENGQKVLFKIKRAGTRNAEWRKLYNEIMKPHEEKTLNGEMSEDESKTRLSQVYARSVVVDWQGVQNSDGEEVPFSVESCMELFQFLPELFLLIIRDSNDRSNFREEQVKATGKN